MFNHELFAVSFARTVHVMRERPPVVATQKSALRAVYALTSIAPATVRVYDGVLSIDDVAMPGNIPHVAELVSQMTAHGVVEIAIARGASPADLLELVRALAVDPGGFAQGDSVERRMRDSGSSSIAVLSVQPSEERPEGRRPASVTQAFEMAGLADLPGFQEAPPDPPPAAAPSAAVAHDDAGPFGTPMTEIDLGFTADDLPVPEAAAAAAARAEPAAAPAADERPEESLPVAANSDLGRALAALRRHPYALDVLDLLTHLSDAFTAAMQRDETGPAVRAAAAAIMLEPGAPEGSPKNSYAIVFKRMLTRDVLVQVAPLLLAPDEAAAATFVLHRAGPVGADVLLGLLGTSETMKERKAYMNALRGIPSGTEQVVHMLDRREWFVVRNVAELCGELRIEEAVPDLAKLLGHSDARVQRAAAVALARIGSNATVTPLLKALKDRNPELRGLIAASIGQRAAPALAMPIAALAAEETNADLLREYYKALGRIATPEAIQALSNAAQPGKLLSRRPTAVRLAAIEGLRLAGSAAALAAVEALTRDGDRTVAGAARSALEAAREAGAGA